MFPVLIELAWDLRPKPSPSCIWAGMMTMNRIRISAERNGECDRECRSIRLDNTTTSGLATLVVANFDLSVKCNKLAVLEAFV